MPQVDVDGITINYDVQGEGEPLLLIPYLSADHACYAFQLPAYTEHFSCIALDLPGTGESDKPAGPYSTEVYADQVAAFLGAIGVEQAHVAGVSLGAAVGMHLAARHPGRVRSLSLHSAWDTSDLYLKTIVELWRTVASTLPSVADTVIQAIFPLCFTPEMYVSRPEFADTLADFVRGRPAQPLDAFLAQTEAAMAHDVSPVLGEIGVPSLITVGAHDLVCSPRFAERINSRIGGSELVVFEHLSHGGLSRGPRDLQPRDARLPAASALVTPTPHSSLDHIAVSRHHRRRHLPHRGVPRVTHIGLLAARGRHLCEQPMRLGPEDHPLPLVEQGEAMVLDAGGASRLAERSHQEARLPAHPPHLRRSKHRRPHSREAVAQTTRRSRRGASWRVLGSRDDDRAA